MISFKTQPCLAHHSRGWHRTLCRVLCGIAFCVGKPCCRRRRPVETATICRWVHKKLVGAGETSETKLAEMLEVGVREVDGGHWHYRQLQSADRDTDLDQGFR